MQNIWTDCCSGVVVERLYYFNKLMWNTSLKNYKRILYNHLNIAITIPTCLTFLTNIDRNFNLSINKVYLVEMRLQYQRKVLHYLVSEICSNPINVFNLKIFNRKHRIQSMANLIKYKFSICSGYKIKCHFRYQNYIHNTLWVYIAFSFYIVR